MGMKQILVMIAVVVLAGCGKKDDGNTGVANTEKLITDPIVEKAVREELEKPQDELTDADLETVTGLGLSATKITDEGLKDVAKLRNLKFLDLTETQITDAGLKEVAKLQKLEQLYLIGTKITDAGLMDLAKLQKLKRLALNRTQITDAGVAELRKALPNCNIAATPRSNRPNPPRETP